MGSPPGNFLGIDRWSGCAPSDPPAPTLALVAGLALHEAVEIAAPGAPLSLKWPNDLLLDGAKLAGILLERSGDAVVVGFGVNLAAAPADRPAATTAALAGSALAPQAFAPLAGRQLSPAGSQRWRAAGPGCVRARLARAPPIRSARRSVHSGPGEQVDGHVRRPRRDGALRLRLADGSIACHPRRRRRS